MTVGEVMSRDVLTLPPEAHVGEAVEHLLAHGRDDVVILGRGGPLGVLTARDLARCRWADERAGLGQRVDSLLPGRTRRLLPRLDVATAAAVLVEEDLEAAPVVNSFGDLVGVFSVRHILQVVATADRDRWS
jgi:CBS domain-containing protein